MGLYVTAVYFHCLQARTPGSRLAYSDMLSTLPLMQKVLRRRGCVQSHAVSGV